MKNRILENYANENHKIGTGKKILFATVPADGHVNPLTALAVHLKSLGYDVRWYTSICYGKKLNKLDIEHYPLVKAMDLRVECTNCLFPERDQYKSQAAKLNFDIINAFILRAPEYYEDIAEIYKTFPFDLMIADFAFSAIPFVKEKMNIPVAAAGIIPLMQTSVDLPPAGLGLTPSNSFFGELKHMILRFIADKYLFKKSIRVLKELCKKHGLSYNGENVFDYISKRSTLVLQSGTPGFEYSRSDLGENIRFVGALLPYDGSKKRTRWFHQTINQYEKVVLVTQGTVEKDAEKLLVPTLEALKETDVLVVATTGGSGTEALRERFPHKNVIIEDFIPFEDIMPYADVYVTNGGYGGVLMGIENELPMVVAGVHEGKNEINARVGYFKLGINMKTETPQPQQVRKAVSEVLTNFVYKRNAVRLAKEFRDYNSNKLCADYIHKLLHQGKQMVEAIEEEFLF